MENELDKFSVVGFQELFGKYNLYKSNFYHFSTISYFWLFLFLKECCFSTDDAGSLSSRQINFINEAKRRWGFVDHVKAPIPAAFSKKLVDGTNNSFRIPDKHF